MWSLFRYFDDDCVVNVLDVGAALGEAPPYQKLVDAGRARVTGFEPDAEACQRLQQTYSATHRFLPLFVGDGREATFRETNFPPTGSLFEPNTPLLSKFWLLESLTRTVATHRVSTTRLDDIADLGEVDFLKIDVQGSELSVFENASKALGQALVLQTEVSFVESYKNQPMFADIDAFLRANGFQYHKILGSGSRSFMPLLNPERKTREFNQEIWGDALYVKDWMCLENLSTEQLKKYAGLMHDIYYSFDLAHLVLLELDHRTGGKLAVDYRRRLMREGEIFLAHDAGDILQLCTPRDVVMARAAAELAAAPGAADDSMVIETADGIAVSVPATLVCLTTYILLEQEGWFEKEVSFVTRYLRPGMTAIDIGANVGVYSLPMAQSVGPNGRVFAYEPGSAQRRHLETSAALNTLPNIQVRPLALSDSARTGWLHRTPSSETNSLVGAECESTEAVEVSSLDAQAGLMGWTSVDFVKIDAEGQEARIVAGGKEFLNRHSPVIMYVLMHGPSHNHAVRWMFEVLGYATYRLLGDGSMLVPVGSVDSLDASELNLFALKPDRAGELAERGLLAVTAAEFALADGERAEVLAAVSALPYARALGITSADIETCPFAEGLIAYGASLFLRDMGPDRRYGALTLAYSLMDRYCAENSSPAALSSFARVAADIGFRSVAISALGKIEAMPNAAIDQPFFPAAPRFDVLPAGDDDAAWFVYTALEQLEFLGSYSSIYAHNLPRLRWLCTKPTASAAILRRAIMAADRSGVPRREIDQWRSRLQTCQTRNLHVWGQDIVRLSELLGA